MVSDALESESENFGALGPGTLKVFRLLDLLLGSVQIKMLFMQRVLVDTSPRVWNSQMVLMHTCMFEKHVELLCFTTGDLCASGPQTHRLLCFLLVLILTFFHQSFLD